MGNQSNKAVMDIARLNLWRFVNAIYAAYAAMRHHCTTVCYIVNGHSVGRISYRVAKNVKRIRDEC